MKEAPMLPKEATKSQFPSEREECFPRAELVMIEWLGSTSKGRLRYDKETDFPRLQREIENCTSPPIGSFGEEQDYTNDSGPELQEDEEHKSYSKEAERKIVKEFRVSDRLCSPASPSGYMHGKLMIKNCEDFWCSKKEDAMMKKLKDFEENNILLLKEENQQLSSFRDKEEVRAQQRYDAELTLFNQGAAEVDKTNKLLCEEHKRHKEMMEQKLEQMKVARQADEQKKQKNQMKLMYGEIVKLMQSFRFVISGCQYKQYLREKVQTFDIVKQINIEAEVLLKHADKSDITNDMRKKMQVLLEQLKKVYDIMKSDVDYATKQGKMEEAKQSTGAAATTTIHHPVPTLPGSLPQESTSSKVSSTTSLTTPGVTKKAAQQNNENGKDPMAEFVDPEALKEYLRLQAKLREVEQILQKFISDSSTKIYRFEIQKAVNIPINAISPISGQHLQDKLMRLIQIVQGNQVEVSGKKISTKEHPQGTLFAKNLIAKMIVKKGAEQVSSNHESAFAIAAVAAGLCAKHSDIKELLLAHFHLVCPYIVPYYIPKKEGQCSEEHLRLLGYQYEEDGVIEKQHKFLKRMTGIMRLYSAIMISPLPPLLNAVAPHGIEHGWLWLARIMNLPPHPDITATLTFDLLEVTGNALFNYYGRQFKKLLSILVTEFMPKLRSVSPSVGSISRLDALLETVNKYRGEIQRPKGHLSASFWNT